MNQEKIQVSFDCPNCHAKKKLRKLPEMKSGLISCPECGTKLRLEFDITVTPQTCKAYIANATPSQSNQQSGNAAKSNKEKTMYKPLGGNMGAEGNQRMQPNGSSNMNQGGNAEKRTMDLRAMGQGNGGYERQFVPGGQMPVNGPRLRENIFITRLGGFMGKTPMEKFQIFDGNITIGREDPEQQSDIMFNHDPEMSRRSIMITIIPDPRGTICRLKVLKSTNPIIVGQRQLVHGEEVALRFGDVITLGRTKLLFSNQ